MSIKSLLPFFMLFFLLIACEEEDNEPDHYIASEEFSEGIFYTEYHAEGINFSIETTDSATFVPAEDKTTMDISESGNVTGQYEPGLYWVRINWENEESDLLPVVVTPHPQEAKNTIYALSHMEEESDNFILVLRHVNANTGEDVGDESGIQDWWMSCDPDIARQIDDNGKYKAKTIGNNITKVKMPVSLGISSEFCRAKQTFEFMGVEFPVQIDGRLNHHTHNVSPNSTYQNLEDIIIENPQESGVLLIVGHSNLLDDNPYSDLIGDLNMADGFLMKREGEQINFVGAVPFWYWSLLCDCLQRIKGVQ
ncbi:histidine phosphatase family protein [Catalinimonas niigatensis]|uniref:hypothetical protein n=1 Tax=Catalinimonas niigatensis TaxID=1397264 RepID=UPI0026668EE1|nr:hypothetical protein [Catalinimonas niigatensis]WPP49167.1 hypothetical protein PZB72_21095 [Catalinimonas niigatensis]